MFRVDVVLPCLNEAGALPQVLASLPPGYRAIVVDNGSTDGSAHIAGAAGARVVRESRRGYGAAVHAGLTAAEAPIVAFADADASFDLSELPAIVDPVASGEVDLMLGFRVAQARGAWPWHARLANRYLARRISAAARVPLRDLGPLRAARREPLLDLGIRDRRSGYPLETVLRAAAAGWRIAEAPVRYRPRVGVSKVTGTVRGTATAITDMSRVLREVS
ncbi:MAG: glycosyltransferase [Microbacterium sp.]|nr:glycosyltransferase [Microbacterium sp.]|tara:strand:+ start:61 stop:720 length:660 start_codon:yes stop_codon:yes gene_type:complete